VFNVNNTKESNENSNSIDNTSGDEGSNSGVFEQRSSEEELSILPTPGLNKFKMIVFYYYLF